MTNCPFKVTFVPRCYSARAAQRAVLASLYKYPRTSEDVAEQTRLTWRLKQLALTRLKDSGLRFPGGPKQFKELRGCRGAFCKCVPVRNHCDYTSFCPFCFGRTVSDQWERVYGTMLLLQKQGVPYRLVELHDQSFMGFEGEVITPARVEALRLYPKNRGMQPYYPLPQELMTQFVKQLRGTLQEHIKLRGAVINQCKPLAAYATLTIEPWPTCWHLMFRSLLVVPDPWPREDWLIARKIRNTPAQPRRAVGALSRVCRYPTYMLRSDPAMLSVQLLACQGLRLSANFGLFRDVGDGKCDWKS